VSLSTSNVALSGFSVFLGANFEKLGKDQGAYLEFKEGVWGIRYFGCIERILRDWFGFYANTHLKFVASMIPADAPAPLINKIRTSWQKAYPTEAVPVHLQPRAVLPPLKPGEERVGETIIATKKGDITKERVDCIVNAANSRLKRGLGVDDAIHAAAGPGLQKVLNKMMLERKGKPMDIGEAVKTGPFKLPCQAIIHTVGPMYNKHTPEESKWLLGLAVTNSLKLAQDELYRTISFPLISGGAYGYPPEAAEKDIREAMRDYAEANPGAFDQINLVLFLPESRGE
jgi:O-acetyl-ADP-ribose deacetylase (regulator of RNase III)